MNLEHLLIMQIHRKKFYNCYIYTYRIKIGRKMLNDTFCHIFRTTSTTKAEFLAYRSATKDSGFAIHKKCVKATFYF